MITPSTPRLEDLLDELEAKLLNVMSLNTDDVFQWGNLITVGMEENEIWERLQTRGNLLSKGLISLTESNYPLFLHLTAGRKALKGETS